MSVYWNEQAPWDPNDTVKVRECKNGCKQVVYYNEHLGRFCNLNDGHEHKCPNFKKSNTNNGNNNNSSVTSIPKPSHNNTTTKAAGTETIGDEVFLKGQLEELRRAVDHLGRIAMFVESMDFRLKKIEEHYSLQEVPPRPDLSTGESDSSEIIGGV